MKYDVRQSTQSYLAETMMIIGEAERRDNVGHIYQAAIIWLPALLKWALSPDDGWYGNLTRHADGISRADLLL